MTRPAHVQVSLTVCLLLAGCAGSCHRSDYRPGSATANVDRGTPPPPPSASDATKVEVCGSKYAFPPGPTYATQSGPKRLSRITSWAPGVPGGVPQRETVCATLSPSGGLDDGPIRDAIAKCPDNQVVKLNPGTFKVGATISFRKSNVVLRGSGGPGVSPAKQTRLEAEPSLYGAVVSLGPDLWPHANGPSIALAEDALQGARSVKVASTQGFVVGDLVLVDIMNDKANDQGKWLLEAPKGGTGLSYPYSTYSQEKAKPGSESRGWFTRMDRPVSQVMEVESIADGRLTFTTPFHQTFDVAHAAQATLFRYNGEQSTPLLNAGLEDLHVLGAPAPGGQSQDSNIVLTLAKHSWVKNVESSRSKGNSIGVYHSFRCTVRDSFMHDTVNPTPGGAGYGLAVSLGSADNLVENNISWSFNKVMLMPGAGGGNVVAYNYMDDGYIAYQPNWVESGLNASHMTTSHFELFEGNLSFAMGSEDTWGNATFITWLRNVATGRRAAWPPLNSYVFNASAGKPGGCTSEGPFDQACIPYTDKAPRTAAVLWFGHVFYNFVGNVLGYRDMPLAPQKKGFAYASEGPEWPGDPTPMWMIGFDSSSKETDQGVVNTTFRDANFDYATKSVQPGGSAPIPTSLYLCQKPAFFGNLAWPWVDGSNAGAPYQTHPYRFFALSETLGTPLTSGDLKRYEGFGLPAFVRFLQLKGIEKPDAACAGASPGNAPPVCSLLLKGVAP